MKVYAHINTVPNGSTGGIMFKEHEELLSKGDDSYAFWGRGRVAENEHEMRFANNAEVYADVALTRLDGRAGFHSKTATERLLKRLNEIKPDVVHLHNLHGYYLNVEMLFEWLLKQDCRVEWTLHDCWAFTGHCAYFTYAQCDRWRHRCGDGSLCPQLDSYPMTFAKRSCAANFSDKQRIFTSVSVDRLTLITPSQWLADLVGESFLAKYPVEVRHNTIDTTVFKPTPSDFRTRYGIGDRFMVLGVATPWSERKGLPDFIRLAAELDSEKFAIVLVGLSDKQMHNLPEGIVGIKRTDSREELATIYTAADVLFNPTKEDNYPSTLLEAQACGTPVITYNVGGCAEALSMPLSASVSGFEEAVGLIAKLEKRNVVNQ